MSDFANDSEGMATLCARHRRGRRDVVCDLLPSGAELDKSLLASLGYVPFGSNARIHLDQVGALEVRAIRIERLGARRVNRDVDAKHGSEAGQWVLHDQVVK